MHTDINAPVATLDIPFKFRVQDFSILEYIHLIPNVNQIIVQLHHAIADGRFYFQLLESFIRNIPCKKGLFMCPAQIISQKYKVPSLVEVHKAPENDYELPTLPGKTGCNALTVICDTTQYQNMCKRLTQKQQIIIALITLRVLQHKNLLSYEKIIQLLQSANGINCISQTVIDLRPLCLTIQNQVNCGAGISFYDTVFNIKYRQLVSEFVEAGTKNLELLKRQQQYLQYINGVKTYKSAKLLQCPGTSSVGKFELPFVSFGLIQHDYQRVKDGEWFMVSNTVNGIMTMLLQYTDTYIEIQPKLQQWLELLMSNMDGQKTIGELFESIQ